MAALSNRRSTIRASINIVWENHENGYLIDFLERVPSDVQSRHRQTGVGAQLCDLPIAGSKRVQEHRNKQDAEELKKFERLLTALFSKVTKFWKAQGDPEWKKSGVKLWIDHAKQIVQHKREAHDLKVDVNNFLLQYRLLNSKVKGVEETAAEREIRLQHFFAQFHAGSRQKYTGAGSPSLMLEKSFFGNHADAPTTPEGPSSPARSMSQPALSNTWERRAARSRDLTLGSGRLDWAKPISSRPQQPSSMFAMCGSNLTLPESPQKKQLPALARQSRGSRSDSKIRADDFKVVTEPRATAVELKPILRNPPTRRGQAREGLEDVDRPFAMPWRSGGPATRDVCSPSTQYLRSCDSTWTLPKLLPCMTGHSTKFRAVGQDLSNADLEAVSAMFKRMTILEEVDLEGNALLTERSLVPFLGILQGEPASSSLSRLSLRGCLQQARLVGIQAVMDVVTMLLSEGDGLRCLRQLDLGGIHLGMKSHLDLSRAIRHHPSLQALSLSGTKLGESNIALQCVGEIIGNKSLETLDLGWNKFDAEVFTHLGECLEYVLCLRSLSIANCSCFVNQIKESSSTKKMPSVPVSSVVFLLEHLNMNKTLRFIDISMNRIDFRGALVIEDSLANHGHIRSLDVSHNPLRVLGMRSLVRLLARGSSGITSFKAEFCSGALPSDAGLLAEKPPPSEGAGIGVTESLDGEVLFCATNPGGSYRLNLQNQYHRSVLRMLYKTCERLGVNAEHAIEVSGSGYHHPTKEPDGFWPVLTRGNFVVHLNIQKATEGIMKGVGDHEFSKFLKRHHAFLRTRPCHRKLIPMLALWQQLETHAADQQLFLNALSEDFRLTYAQVQQLCRGSMLNRDIIGKLLNCIDGEMPAAWMTMLLVPNAGEYITLLRSVWKFIAFNAENPTGHHKLDLSNPAEHGVAERLMLLDCWESGLARRLGRPDVSQRGNRSCIRNETHQERPLAFLPNLSVWILPEWGVLTLDYVSSKRPPAGAPVLDDETLSEFLIRMPNSGLPTERQIEAMRRISHHVYLNALQLRSLLVSFRWEAERQEIAVLFFLRVADMHNEKVYRVRFSNEEVARLRKRLGVTTCCPFIQPEQSVFRWDFSIFEERVCANIMLNLVAKENPRNLKDPVFVRGNGEVDPLPSGIPFSWQKFEFMEKEGIFTCRYNSAPEHRNIATRKSNMETYGLWVPPATEDEVMWWSDFMEAPEDVRTFLEFLVSRFSDLGRAFTMIDGPCGNGTISLKGLLDGVKMMKCRKFEGQNEEERIRSIFRYLDPGGEGSISREEWNVLDMLFLEIQLSISDFVKVLIRNFGSLSMAWCFLDEDESDELSMDEWIAASREIGFFGLAKPIFSFLDKADSGSISEDQFQALEAFVNFTPLKRSVSS